MDEVSILLDDIEAYEEMSKAAMVELVIVSRGLSMVMK